MDNVLNTIVILWLASFLDYLIGDPWGWIHPVQVIGWFISSYSKFILDRLHSKLLRKLAGVILATITIIGSGLITWLMIYFAQQINPILAILIQIILLASCFAGKSLRKAGEDVLQYLVTDSMDITQARSRLSMYVGRDTDNLDSEEIYRAVLETVTENATDGVTAPLFYALLGALIATSPIVPLAMAYKASSTLDSMVGYRNETYIDLGWFSAKVEDYLTWIPCRLTVLTLAIVTGNTIDKWQRTQTYAIQDPSPNSGWSESIYAVILGVQLGGVNIYKGEKKIKPLLGEAINTIDSDTIEQALSLTRICFLLWLTIVSVILLMGQLTPMITNLIY